MLDPQWTGTNEDRRDMRKLNLEQVVRRNFGTLAMFGFSSTLLCTWETLAVTLGVALSNGGTAGLFWNYVIATVGLGFVYASIAELGSMIPTSGGQYYWVAVMAPRSCRRYLSYITGWFCAISWQAGLGGSAYLAGTIIQALCVINIPDFDYERWQGSLMGLGFLAIGVVFNTLLARRLPMIEGIFVACHIIGVVIFIPVLALAPKREGGSPLVEFYNPSGWISNGVATLVSINSPITSLIGFDCSVHMSEETRDSSLIVPITLLSGYTSNVLLGFFVLMTCIYTIGPLDQALQSASGYPVLDLFYSSTKSLAATDVMATVLLINFTACTIGILAASSRQLWAFARNGGVPFSRFFAPAHLPYDIPLTSVLFSLTISIILLLVNISSTQVLGIILSIYNSALISSYGITIGCVLLHRLCGKLPPSRFSLGRWGVLMNVGALVYLAPIFIFTFFPPVPNPTPSEMNWGSVMVGGVAILATIYYFIWGKSTYTPPSDTIQDYIERDQAMPSLGETEAGGLQVEKVSEMGKKLM